MRRALRAAAPMANETQARVLAVVTARAGRQTSEVATGAGIDESTADYHLRRLAKEGRILSERVGRGRCWFPAARGFCPVLRRAIPALDRPEARAVAAALTDAPRSASQVSQASGVPVPTVRWVAGVLEDALLLQRSRAGFLMLREGAEPCRGKAARAEGCDQWGRCPMARALQQEARGAEPSARRP